MCVSVIKEPHRGGLGPLRLSNHDEKNNLLTCLHLSCLHSNVVVVAAAVVVVATAVAVVFCLVAKHKFDFIFVVTQH